MARLLVVLGFVGLALAASPPDRQEWTDEQFPSYIKRLTHFGGRADWSHDGKRILFLAKTYGDVFEVEVATGIVRPLTHHYHHNGYVRALYLANGDILLSGARTFNPSAPHDSRFSNPELWILDKDLDQPPTPLGEFCWEGPAVSRKQLRIAWSVKHGIYPRNTRLHQIWVADVDYSSGTPRLANERMVLDSRDCFDAILEPQNFRPPEERELIFQSSHDGTEVMGLDLETSEIINYSNEPTHYDEPEGIFPDGLHTLVECNLHRGMGGGGSIDLYKLRLDGSGQYERLTWFNEGGAYKASNPVVSDDGRFIAFQVPRLREIAGVGHGIYIMDLQAAGK
jgi:hypothetical protein